MTGVKPRSSARRVTSTASDTAMLPAPATSTPRKRSRPPRAKAIDTPMSTIASAASAGRSTPNTRSASTTSSTVKPIIATIGTITTRGSGAPWSCTLRVLSGAEGTTPIYGRPAAPGRGNRWAKTGPYGHVLTHRLRSAPSVGSSFRPSTTGRAADGTPPGALQHGPRDVLADHDRSRVRRPAPTGSRADPDGAALAGRARGRRGRSGWCSATGAAASPGPAASTARSPTSARRWVVAAFTAGAVTMLAADRRWPAQLGAAVAGALAGATSLVVATLVYYGPAQTGRLDLPDARGVTLVWSIVGVAVGVVIGAAGALWRCGAERPCRRSACLVVAGTAVTSEAYYLLDTGDAVDGRAVLIASPPPASACPCSRGLRWGALLGLVLVAVAGGPGVAAGRDRLARQRPTASPSSTAADARQSPPSERRPQSSRASRA